MPHNQVHHAAQNYYIDSNSANRSPKWRKGLIFMAFIAIGLLYIIYQNDQEKKRRKRSWF